MLLLLAGLVIGVGVAGVLFAPKIFAARPSAAPPAQAPMPSSPSLKVLDVKGTCVLLVPVAQDGANAVLALAAKPDGSTIDWAKVQKTHDDLRLIAEVAAPELRDDIGQQAALLSQLLSMKKTGTNMTLDLDDFRTSGLRIGARCAEFAS